MPSEEKFLITGANGFVGRSLLDHLLTLPDNYRPSEVATVTRSGLEQEVHKKYSLSGIKLKSFEANLLDKWDFSYEPTHVFNFAADGSNNAYSVEAANGFRKLGMNLITWCSKIDNVSVFHTSSGACFGRFPLASPAGHENKKFHFIESRIEVESMLREMANFHNLSLRMARLFSFIGPHLTKKPQYAVIDFINQALTKKRISVTGHPGTVRSYLSSSDMSVWIHKAATFEKAYDDLVVGSSHPVQMHELASHIGNRLDSPVEILPSADPKDVYVANNQSTLDRLAVQETKPWWELVDDLIEQKLRNV